MLVALPASKTCRRNTCTVRPYQITDLIFFDIDVLMNAEYVIPFFLPRFGLGGLEARVFVA